MNALLPFIVIGVAAGSVYGLTATGLVLTYKTSGIFNFAQGSLAALAVFVFYYLNVDRNVPWPIAALISVFALGIVMGIGMEFLARLLADSSDTIKIASTVGIVVSVLSLGTLLYPDQPQVPPYLPTSTAFRLFSVNVSWQDVIVTLVALIAAAVLYVFFRYFRLGMAMRGVVDDDNLVAMTGVSPARVRRTAWVIGSVFAAASGVLLAPSLNLSAIILTELVIQAFGAAAIGYFSSLPLTYLGGLVIGVIGAVSTKYVVQIPSLEGLPPSLPFIVLFVALIVTPRARLARRRFAPSKALTEAWHAPPRVRLSAGALFLVFLCCVPIFAGANLAVWSEGVIDIMLFLSLGLLVRDAGQVSLCQYAFVAIGAAAMAHFTTSLGIPWGFALIFSGLLAVPIGAIIAIPAIRLTGVFLALATLGFGILLEQMFYAQSWMFGVNGVPARRPDLNIGPVHLGTDRGFYYLAVLIAAMATAVVLLVHSGRLGRLLRALSDSPLALETYGASINITRVVVFCLSAFLAAITGALTASLFHFAVGSQDSSFSSITLLALLVIIVVGEPWYAVQGSFLLVILPAYINIGNITEYLALIFGLSAVLSPLIVAGPRTPVFIQRIATRMGGRYANVQLEGGTSRGRIQYPVAPPSPATTSAVDPLSISTTRGSKESSSSRSGLEVRALSINYGGSTAVIDLNLRAPIGAVTGLIGPNGAGKTSTFNACCGLKSPSSGQVLLHGEDISRLGTAARAQRGLGRTFQRVELFPSLTVLANIKMGLEAGMSGRNPMRQIRSSRGERTVITDAAERSVELTNIGPLLNRRVAEISTGQRRVVELARVLTGAFDVILMDEPSSGLDQDETAAFGEMLLRTMGQRELGLLIVEHDMSLVRQICDHVHVLDFGRQIFEGSPHELLDSSVVREAYLGSDALVDAGDHEPQEATWL